MPEFCWNDTVIMSQSSYVMPIKKVAGTFRHGGEWRSHHEPKPHGRDARKIVGQFLVTGAKSGGE